MLGLVIPASADTLSSTPATSTTTSIAVTAESNSTVSGTVYNQPSVQAPIDLNTLNSLSIAQLKELQKQIQNVLKQKEESLMEFEGKTELMKYDIIIQHSTLLNLRRIYM